jgi:hypothetical protein
MFAPLRGSRAWSAATLTIRPPALPRRIAATASRQQRKQLPRLSSISRRSNSPLVSVSGAKAKPPATWIEVQPAIELPHPCLIRQARRGDQAQRPAGKTLLLFLLSVGHMAMGTSRQQCIYHRAPQSTRCHRLPPRDDHENPSDPPVPQPQSSGARHHLLHQPRQGAKRSLLPSAASSSISAVIRTPGRRPSPLGSTPRSPAHPFRPFV